MIRSETDPDRGDPSAMSSHLVRSYNKREILNVAENFGNLKFLYDLLRGVLDTQNFSLSGSAQSGFQKPATKKTQDLALLAAFNDFDAVAVVSTSVNIDFGGNTIKVIRTECASGRGLPRRSRCPLRSTQQRHLDADRSPSGEFRPTSP